MNEIETDKLAKVLNEEIIIINDEPFYRIPNGTSYDYAPIPKQFKPYFERLQSQLEQKEDNWNKLKEWLKEETIKLELYKDNIDIDEYVDKKSLLKKILDKMQEIEGEMNE